MAKEVSFAIDRKFGVISERTDRHGNKWTKELNAVSWDGETTKLDIREWNEDHTRMLKGVTLTKEEAEVLYMRLDAILKGGRHDS